MESAGPIVQAILRHAQRCELDPSFFSAETVAYKCGVLSLLPVPEGRRGAERAERLKARIFRHLCEDSTNDYTVALCIARAPGCARFLAMREANGFGSRYAPRSPLERFPARA